MFLSNDALVLMPLPQSSYDVHPCPHAVQAGGSAGGGGAGSAAAGTSSEAPAPPARAFPSGGAVDDYNLRDTDQFLHVVQRNAAAHEAHMRIMVYGGSDVDGSAPTVAGAPAYNRREGLVPFVDLVYAQRLPSAELQLAARALIRDMLVGMCGDLSVSRLPYGAWVARL
jgi:hypothetical protein